MSFINYSERKRKLASNLSNYGDTCAQKHYTVYASQALDPQQLAIVMAMHRQGEELVKRKVCKTTMHRKSQYLRQHSIFVLLFNNEEFISFQFLLPGSPEGALEFQKC